MPRLTLFALPLIIGALLAVPGAADAKPRLTLSVPKTVTKKAVKYRAVATGLKRGELVEIQVFRNGFWAFLQKAERGTSRGTILLKGGIQQTKLRLAVRKLARRNGVASAPRTVRFMGRVTFRDLFGGAPQLFNGKQFVSALYSTIEVPPSKSACTRLNFEVLLAFAPVTQSGTLTVTQAGREPQTITLASNQIASFPVRLTPNRAYRIEPTVPQSVETQGERPRLRINGTGRCFSRDPLPHS